MNGGKMSNIAALADNWELKFTPFGTDETGRAITDISGSAMVETVGAFVRRGGSLEDLVEELRRKQSRFNEQKGTDSDVTKEVLLDAGVAYRDEFYFLANLLMKSLLEDDFFCYTQGDDKLSVSHKIYEAGPLRGAIYTAETDPVQQGVSGRTISNEFKLFKRQTRDRIQKEMQKSSSQVDETVLEQRTEQSVSDLLAAINAFAEEPVDERMLCSENLRFRNEFSQLLFELMKVATGNDYFVEDLGRENLNPFAKLIARPLGIQKGFQMITYFVNKYNPLFRTTAVEVGNGYAVIRMQVAPAFRRMTGRYFRACVKNGCDLERSIMALIPSEIFGYASPRAITTGIGAATFSQSPILETACYVKPVQPDVIANLPRNISHVLREEISDRVRLGETDDFCEYVYSWREAPLRGMWRFILTGAAISAPLVYHVAAGNDSLTSKLVYGAISLIPLVSSFLLGRFHRERQARLAQESTERSFLEEQLRRLEEKETQLTAAQAELRRHIIKEVLQTAVCYIEIGKDAEAQDQLDKLSHEFKQDTSLSTEYCIIIYRQEGARLPDIEGANIKAVRLGETIEHPSLVRRVLLVKKLPSLEEAVRYKDWSDFISQPDAVKVERAFGDSEAGYIIVEEIHPVGKPGKRVPNLLSMHDDDKVGSDVTNDSLDIAARIYARIWRCKEEQSGCLETVYGKDNTTTASADLEETVRKCIGVKGSDEPLTAGLYTYITDDRVISEFESSLRRNAPRLLKRANSLHPMVAFDFTPRNLVRVADGKQCLVDLDRINDLDMPRFFARFTEMGDFIEDKDVVVDADVRVGSNVIYQKGAVVSSKDLLFCDFLSRLYGVADDSLRGEIDSHAGEWLSHFPVARFSKAFRHFGSFSHWSRKYAKAGDADAARAAKRHGLQCLYNSISGLDVVLERGGLDAADKEEVSGLRDAFARLVNSISVAGLRSDLHVHGAVSHCVSKEYGMRPSPADPLDTKLQDVLLRLEEKFDAAKKAGLEELCVVEHTRFIDYGIPFRAYRRILDDVRSRHERDFVRVSFGLELEVRGNGRGVELDLSQLDEKNLLRGLPGISDDDLSSPEEVLAAAEVLLVGLHYKGLKGPDGFYVSDASGYARALEDSVRILAELKRRYGEAKRYVYVHPLKCARDINSFNREDRPAASMIECPAYSELQDFFSILYENDILLEISVDEVETVGKEGFGLSYSSIPIVSQAIEYYSSRNLREGKDKRLVLVRASDAHHHSRLSLPDMVTLSSRIPLLDDPVVLMNRDG